MTLKICVAQLNFIVGDLSGNAQKILDAALQAHAQGARLLLTPELSLCGYAAEDLYLRPAFMQACDGALKWLTAQLAGLQDMCVVVGHPQGADLRGTSVSITQRFNCASVLREGQVVATYAKQELPNYQVFDERRYFAHGSKSCVFEAGPAHALVRVGLLICEDAWFAGPALAAKAAVYDYQHNYDGAIAIMHRGGADRRLHMLVLMINQRGLHLELRAGHSALQQDTRAAVRQIGNEAQQGLAHGVLRAPAQQSLCAVVPCLHDPLWRGAYNGVTGKCDHGCKQRLGITLCLRAGLFDQNV
jgi:predicted amidohydrolase